MYVSGGALDALKSARDPVKPAPDDTKSDTTAAAVVEEKEDGNGDDDDDDVAVNSAPQRVRSRRTIIEESGFDE